MKKKATFPDWTSPAYMIVSSGGKDGKRPVWKPYQKEEQDLLSLRVTVEIAGGFPVLFSQSMSREAVEAERLERDRCAAWIFRTSNHPDESRIPCRKSTLPDCWTWLRRGGRTRSNASQGKGFSACPSLRRLSSRRNRT